MKGIILHGGHGTRLRPLTHTGPKQLLPIANKPMSQYCIESIHEAGITDIAIIIGGLGASKVREYYGNGENFGVNITYIEQDKPRGIAHAIRLCKGFVSRTHTTKRDLEHSEGRFRLPSSGCGDSYSTTHSNFSIGGSKSCTSTAQSWQH